MRRGPMLYTIFFVIVIEILQGHQKIFLKRFQQLNEFLTVSFCFSVNI